MSIPVSAPIASGAAQQAPKINPLLRTGKDADGNYKGEDHFSFRDVLDIINPLQHIPVINNIYRKITGDEISNAARIAGDTLYGGPIGAAFGIANAIAVNETGNDLGGVAMTKMGLIKSQEQAQAKNIDVKNLQVVEVHPAQTAEKQKIIWDQPVSLASIGQPSSSNPAMPSPKDLNDITPGDGQSDTQADTKDEQPKQLEAVVNPSADPSISKDDIQKNMMSGLDKYNALQKSANPGLIVPPITAQTAKALDAAADQPKKNIFALPSAGPLTNLAASPSSDETEEQIAVAKKPTAAFNSFRHY